MNRFKKIVLKNGLRVVLVPQPESLAASVLILVEAGSEYETKRVSGISHFLEHMTFKGTVNRPKPGAIAEEFAGLGAQSNAFTSREYTGYWAKAESRKVHEILDIVSDLYLNPIFAPEEIEKERGVVIEEINMYEDSPPNKVQRIFNSLVYGDQPAGWDVAGEKETVKKIMRDDLVKYRDERYRMRGTVIAVSGKFNERAVIAQLRATFGHFNHGRPAAKLKTKDLQSGPRIELSFKESDQAHLVLGFRAFDLFDRRRYEAQALADILGGGMSARLFKRVREEMGAAYYIGADADLLLDHGMFTISAGVDRSKIDVVLRAVLEECRDMRDELVPPAELRRSKDHAIGNLILGLETSDELGSFYACQELLANAPLRPDQLTDRINRVTAEGIRRTARAIFTERKMNFAVVGPYKNQASFKKILTL